MSKINLIKRLSWYYPMEKMHAFLTFPVIAIYFIYNQPFSNIIFLLYGLAICIFILFQGQLYWNLKLCRLQGKTIEQEKKQFVRQTQEDIKRLGTLQQETLKFEQQKAQNELAQKLVRLALHQVREKLNQRLNSSIHTAVNHFQIVLFTNYKPN